MDALNIWIAGLPDTIQKEINAFTIQNTRQAFLETVPTGKARPRFTRKGRCYTPKATQSAEQQAKCAARLQNKNARQLTGAIGVLVLAVFPVPASWTLKKKKGALVGTIRPAVKPDFDNVAKLYCDALNGILWEDDKQIVDGRCIKIYGQQPGVLIIGWSL